MSNFAKQIYAILAKKVPAGKVTTYKSLAKSIGSKAYRAVGQVMNRNPHSFFSEDKKVPCHRVINSDGSLGGFAIGSQAKIDLLAKEGIILVKGKVPEEHILRRL